MRLAVGFKCEICGVTEHQLGYRLVVDHCHGSGHIRGLLCQNCNRGVGMFKDTAQLMMAAAYYIQQRSET